jgi:hypothetical protein
MESPGNQNANLDNGLKKSSTSTDSEETLLSSHKPETLEDVSVSELVNHFVDEDRKLQHESCKIQAKLIPREKLITIVQKSKRNNTPYELLGYLWELNDVDPEFGPPPMVRSLDALTEVLRSFWEKRSDTKL